MTLRAGCWLLPAPCHLPRHLCCCLWTPALGGRASSCSSGAQDKPASCARSPDFTDSTLSPPSGWRAPLAVLKGAGRIPHSVIKHHRGALWEVLPPEAPPAVPGTVLWSRHGAGAVGGGKLHVHCVHLPHSQQPLHTAPPRPLGPSPHAAAGEPLDFCSYLWNQMLYVLSGKLAPRNFSFSDIYALHQRPNATVPVPSPPGITDHFQPLHSVREPPSLSTGQF